MRRDGAINARIRDLPLRLPQTIQPSRNGPPSGRLRAPSGTERGRRGLISALGPSASPSSGRHSHALSPRLPRVEPHFRRRTGSWLPRGYPSRRAMATCQHLCEFSALNTVISYQRIGSGGREPPSVSMPGEGRSSELALAVAGCASSMKKRCILGAAGAIGRSGDRTLSRRSGTRRRASTAPGRFHHRATAAVGAGPGCSAGRRRSPRPWTRREAPPPSPSMRCPPDDPPPTAPSAGSPLRSAAPIAQRSSAPGADPAGPLLSRSSFPPPLGPEPPLDRLAHDGAAVAIAACCVEPAQEVNAATGMSPPRSDHRLAAGRSCSHPRPWRADGPRAPRAGPLRAA